jgi:DmsE family decaheme c-type cytochrome
MPNRTDGFPGRLIATALMVLCLAVIGLAAATPKATSAPSAAAGAGQTTGFVGDETCATCHDTQATALRATLHGKAQNTRTPAASNGQACETCHGAGQKHVASGKKEDIRRFDVLSAHEANAACLNCHSKGKHADWQGSMHDARNVSCVTCHSVHSSKSAKAQLKTVTITQTCENCHKQEAVKVQKAAHMPVREGKMECTSCHSPHGSSNVRMLKVGNSLNEACASCHTEKRGPHLWEHAAGRENCASCHDPHGSNNDRMLVAKVPMLCQRCHISSGHPPIVYDQTQITAGVNRAVGRACVNCHSQIHGSNSPSGYRFLR